MLVAIFAPWLAPYGATQDGFPRNADASWAHWFGTTAAGEDVLSQLIYGTRISVTVGFIAGALSTLVAVLIGLMLRTAAGRCASGPASYVRASRPRP